MSTYWREGTLDGGMQFPEEVGVSLGKKKRWWDGVEWGWFDENTCMLNGEIAKEARSHIVR